MPRALLERLLAQLRLYMWPFAVRQIEERGRGFVFLQSEVSRATLGLPAPRSPCGRLLEHRRSLILHHVTLAEFDGEICDAFPGLGGARPALAAALAEAGAAPKLVGLLQTCEPASAVPLARDLTGRDRRLSRLRESPHRTQRVTRMDGEGAGAG